MNNDLLDGEGDGTAAAASGGSEGDGNEAGADGGGTPGTTGADGGNPSVEGGDAGSEGGGDQGTASDGDGAGEGGDGKKADPAADPDKVDEKGVLWKNRAMEGRRKMQQLGKEFMKLKSELEEIKKGQGSRTPGAAGKVAERLQAVKAKLKSMYHDDAIEGITEYVDALLSERGPTQSEDPAVRTRNERFMHDFYTDRREKVLDRIAKKNPEVGPILSLITDEVNEALDGIDMQQWGDEDAVMIVIGSVMTRNFGKIKQAMMVSKDKKIVKATVEGTSPAAGGKGGTGTMPAGYKEWLTSQNYADTPQARKAYQTRMKTLSELNSKK